MSFILSKTDKKNPVSNEPLVNSKKAKLPKNSSILMTMLPLAACGGGGGGGGGGGNAAPPAPVPAAEFIEDPAGVFIALDDRVTNLEQGTATTDLTVTGNGGNDAIYTGSGADTIDGGNGNDQIRAGEGADNVNGGGGNDAIVLVGTTTANQYSINDIVSAGNGFNLSRILSTADLNGRTTSEVVAGDVIDGGTGTNTLIIYGVVDLTGVTLSNVTVLQIHSDVTLTPEQIAMFTTVDGDGNSVINIEVPTGPDTYILDLSALDMTDIATINVDGDLTVVISDASDLDGVANIAPGAGDTMTVEVNANGAVNLGDLSGTFSAIDEIELSENTTLDIDDPADITGLGLDEISGDGTIETNGNDAVDDALDGITVDVAINTLPNVVADSAETTENTAITVDVLANDSDGDGDALSLVGVSVGSGMGSVSIVDGEVHFDPGSDFSHLNGGQSEDVDVTYIVSDGTDTVEGTLTVTVNGEIDYVYFSDGSRLTDLSLSSNNVTRGDDGVELNFAVDGDPVTITVAVEDTFGNHDLFTVTGTEATMLLPMDGTERQTAGSNQSNISQYTISAIYIEDADGVITALNTDNFNAYSFDPDVDVFAGSVPAPDTSPPEISAFDISLGAVTLGDGEDPQLISFTKDGSSSEIDGVLVKFIDDDGVLHSNYFDASSGTFEFYLDPLTAPTGTYTLYSVEVFGMEGNSNHYSASEIEAMSGASETSFTLTNASALDLGDTSGTPYTYLPTNTFVPSGDIMVDGVMSGYELTSPAGNAPLIITYSFVDPDTSFFTPGYSTTDYEEAENINSLSGFEQEQIRQIFDNISEDINIIFVEVPEDGTSSAGHMRIGWTNGGTEDVGNTSAWAYYPGNYVQSSDVWLIEGGLDEEMAIDVSNSVFMNVVLHEMSHGLGLKHPFEEEGDFGLLPDQYDGNEHTVMSYDMLATGSTNFDNYALPTDLMAFDIAALQYMYGANDDRTSGNDTYQFLPVDWNYFTVWDSGGIDTFDFSLYEDGVTVDLRPGNWSDVGIVIDVHVGPSNIRYETLQIASDTLIENAVGGDGNDDITGNDADNMITGGAGADDMSGGLGDDTFAFSGGHSITSDTINGGVGTDSLLLEGGLGALDLDNISADNIEIIESTEVNSLNLTLDLNDLISVTDADNELIIAGGAGDSVTSTGFGWVQGADQVIDDQTYHTYTAGAGTLLIDEDIAQTIS